MTAEEIYNKWVLHLTDDEYDEYEFTKSELIDFAETYHQAKIEYNILKLAEQLLKNNTDDEK